MEVRTLRYFIAVVDYGSVTAAAEVVHVTQPSLSRQLRLLEREIGFDLFNRADKRLVPNAAGRQFLPFARDLVNRFELVERAAQDIAFGTLRSIRITATATTTQDVIAPFVATWTSDDPVPDLATDLPSNIFRALFDGSDLVVGTERPGDEWSWIPLAKLPVWAFVSEVHPWAAAGSIDISEFVTEEIFVLSADHQSRKALDEAIAVSKVSPPRIIELSSPEVAQAMVSAGRGVAALSDDPRFGAIPVSIRTRTGPVSVRLYAAWDKKHHGALALSELAARLHQFCIAKYGPEAGLN